jgi:anthranilate synthase/aminodeoxychorismate synthase-like glutamine amidotransferase
MSHAGNIRILLVDNNDSFTWNIVDLLRSIDGCEGEVISYNKLTDKDIASYNRIIFSPGPGVPDEFPGLKNLLEVHAGSIPILGICLGHQAICTYYGAQLTNMPKVKHGQSIKVNVQKSGIFFKDIPQNFVAGLYHSWQVDKTGFPEELDALAHSEEGNIMAVAHKTYPVYGVQFHPESFLTTYGQQMLENFIFHK